MSVVRNVAIYVTKYILCISRYFKPHASSSDRDSKMNNRVLHRNNNLQNQSIAGYGKTPDFASKS